MKSMHGNSTYKEKFCNALIQHLAKGYSYQSFAQKLGIHKTTLYQWELSYPQFFKAKQSGRELSFGKKKIAFRR